MFVKAKMEDGSRNQEKRKGRPSKDHNSNKQFIFKHHNSKIETSNSDIE